jgi:predicted TIM-barrel fold metal-dependent hydrolase
MNLEDMILVSVDDHIIEPADMFERHLPERYRDQGPKYVFGAPDEIDHWEYQGQPTGSVGLNAVASWPRREWGFDAIGQKEMRPGCYDLGLRVRDMDANGVLSSMCFPTFAGFNGMSLARSTIDMELTKVVVAAYNDWHIDELAGEHPGRFIPLAITPVGDSEAMAAEIVRVAAKGCHAVTLPETPYGVGLPSYADGAFWDPVFRACSDQNVVICLHIGGAFGLLQRPKDGGFDNFIVLAPQFSAVTASDILLAGTFKRFPDLKFALSEGGIGWIAFLLDRIDRHMWNHMWTGLTIAASDMTPTEIWKHNFLGCFITDPAGLQNRQRVGIETLAWECDYPHSDSTWPTSPELLWEELRAAELTDKEINKVTWQNACRFFSFDPFAAVPKENATVGALRATADDVDTAETSRSEYKRRWLKEHQVA